MKVNYRVFVEDRGSKPWRGITFSVFEISVITELAKTKSGPNFVLWTADI
jgi:hypothetical protein